MANKRRKLVLWPGYNSDDLHEQFRASVHTEDHARMSIFKVFGWLTVALGLVALFGVVANLIGKPLGGHSLAPLASAAVLSIWIGLGLVFHRKWAAALFAVLLGVAGFWIGVMSVVRVPMPWLILNVGLECALLAPSALVVLRWSQLNGK